MRPDTNRQMEDKWKELYNKYFKNGISMRDWFKKAGEEYEVWRLLGLIQDASIAGTTAPPLHRVGFESAKAWANGMKAVGNAPLRCGAIDEASQQLATQVQSLLENTTHEENVLPFQRGGMGAAIDATSLSLHDPTATTGTQLVPPPTLAQVKVELATKPPPKKKRRTDAPKVIDPVLVRRREVAALMMRQEGITLEQVTDKRKRCQVCFKLSDFKYQNVPHAQFGKCEKGSKPFRFCPLADDHELYHNYVQKRDEDKRDYKKRRYAESIASK